MRRRLFLFCSTLALVVAACGGGTDTGAETDTAAPVEPPTETSAPAVDETTPAENDTAAASGATVAVASSDLGEILVDGEGRTLYLFLPDEQGAPTCYDDCAQNWPPLTGEEPTAGEGADASLLATAERDDGSIQVTYNDWPLYYFAADQQPGDTNGQGVGDVWYVVSPSGEPIRETAAADAGGAGSADESGY